ncbi:MAG: hypothetical protein HRU05_08625 [Oceanospirillaceae bacterium]|nr:hypothetical protein [Oceanospirillaceae bacterium]
MKTIYKFYSDYLTVGSLTKLMIGCSIFLVGCAAATSSIGLHTAPVTHYLLNEHTGSYCQGYADASIKGQCQSLIPVATNILDTRVIGNIYQQQITEPNRIASLIGIILRGDNLDYRATLLDNGLYSVPVNQQTNTVWSTLKRIDNNAHSD